ncbi:hypothetical protein Tco_0585182 [Tanacetum coccineum]
MGDENPIHTLRDESRPSHEGYRNTIELLDGNNVVPLRADTIRLVQNGCSIHGIRSKDPNQHLKDYLKLVDSLDLDDPSPPGESLSEAWTRFKDLLQKFPHHGIDIWLQVCINPRSWGKQLASPFRELKRKIKKRTKSEKTPNVPLEIESPETYTKQPFIEELFVVTPKIKILVEKFKTPPDSPPVIVIDLDDQPMWLSTRTVAPTPSSSIIQLLIPNHFHIKGTHMKMIRDNQFDRRIRSDPHRHVADFLEISKLFQYGENQEEVFRRLLNEIHNFHQLDNETLVDAWLRMKEMLRICYGHGLTKGTIIQIFYHGLDDPTQGVLDAGGIFHYNTPNKSFKILEVKVHLKLDFSKDSQNNPKLKTRKELKEMRDDRRDNHASHIYMKDDTSMCDPMEANYVQRYHGGYHDQNSINSQTEANEHMKDHVVELERQIDQGLRSRQAKIRNLKRQFEYLEKIQPTESLPRTKNTKPRQEFVYKPSSIRSKNDKGDVADSEEDDIKPILTMPNPKPIKPNSPTVSPFLKDCIVHISYTNAKTFTNNVLLNQFGDKELKSTLGVGTSRTTKKEIKKDDVGLPKETNKEWKLN